MNVRTIELSDSEQVAKLMGQLGYDASAALIRSKISEFKPREFDEIYVACEGQQVLGCISCHITSVFHKQGSSGRITSLAIDESVRGKGVGKLLVAAADTYFLSKGAIQAEVTSGDHRADAHSFYESQGYKRDERRFIKRYI